MKALFYKDWLMLCKKGKMFPIFTVFFALIGVIDAGETDFFYFFFSSLYLCMVPMTLLGLEEQVKWESYSTLLPISRKIQVAEKYLLAVLGLFTGILINLGLHELFEKNCSDLIESIPIILMVGLLFIAFDLPLIYKLGVAKARAGYVLLIALASGSVVLSSKLFGADAEAEAWNVVVTPGIRWGGVAAAFWLFMVSMAISIVIFEKKEV